MRDVEIPGGIAHFRERGQDEIPIRAQKIMGAAMVAAQSNFPDTPGMFEPGPEGETEEQREKRLGIERTAMSAEQVLALMALQEASVIGFLNDWTLERPLPTLQNLPDLEEDLYMALMGAVGGIASSDLVDSVDFSPKPLEEGETPTSGSSDSEWQSGEPAPSL